MLNVTDAQELKVNVPGKFFLVFVCMFVLLHVVTG